MTEQPPKQIEIFRAGTHTTMNGQQLEFTEADLFASAAAYSPAKHEAPLVVGHPKHDAPAYGWVAGMTSDGKSLSANVGQLDAAFGEMVTAGRFKKISASFYPPGHPGNPAPGVYYLRHVGFLGAQPPAIKGLKAVEFADGDTDLVTIEFGDRERWGWQAMASLLRRLRDKWIEKDGVESADQLLPSYLIDDVVKAGEEEKTMDINAQAFAEGDNHKEDKMAENEKTAADFAEREAGLSAREQALAAKEAEQNKKAAVSFAETLLTDGRILPRHKDGIVSLLTTIPVEKIEFGEGDGKFSGNSVDWLRSFLKDLPPRVDYGEHTAKGADDLSTVDFAAPNGYTVDQAQLAQHQKIVVYQREHNTDYATAAIAVCGNN